MMPLPFTTLLSQKNLDLLQEFDEVSKLMKPTNEEEDEEEETKEEQDDDDEVDHHHHHHHDTPPLKNNNNNTIARLSYDSIKISKLLGTGGYSRVYRASTCINGMYGEYALKCLKLPNNSDPHSQERFAHGAMDLVQEAQILSDLNHENIISLRGISSKSLYESFSNSKSNNTTEKLGMGYFILLDVLDETLTDRLMKWKSDNKRRLVMVRNNSAKSLGVGSESILSKTRDVLLSEGRQFRRDMYQRVESVVLDIVCGLQYLHSQQYVLRDLKPDNVGFAMNETTGEIQVKLFDFGLARQVGKLMDGEVAGSYRYMSPESMIGKTTGTSTDCYSFAILLWEIITLQKPFKDFGKKDRISFVSKIQEGDFRPPLNLVPCKDLRQLIKSCWDPNTKERPTMSTIHTTITKILDDVKQQREMNESNRSAISMRRIGSGMRSFASSSMSSLGSFGSSSRLSEGGGGVSSPPASSDSKNATWSNNTTTTPKNMFLQSGGFGVGFMATPTTKTKPLLLKASSFQGFQQQQQLQQQQQFERGLSRTNSQTKQLLTKSSSLQRVLKAGTLSSSSCHGTKHRRGESLSSLGSDNKRKGGSYHVSTSNTLQRGSGGGGVESLGNSLDSFDFDTSDHWGSEQAEFFDTQVPASPDSISPF